MGISPVSGIEELVDIIADDHPWLLVLVAVLIASLMGLGFYFYFWPIISGQPEYSLVQVLQAPGIDYNVYAMSPKRIEPDEQRQYIFQVEIEQNNVLTTTQQITTTIRPLSPFIKLYPNSPSESMDIRAFSVMPLTSEPQVFSHEVSIIVSRPANRLRSLPIEVGLETKNVRYTQKIGLQIDYWSKLIVYLVTSGAFIGFLVFTVRVVKSFLGM